ncbi:MAG: dihydrolipoyllysine-residue succinyltransferase [Simkaniaceae bacterium]|nr:dihydrolipoyllysine-residue succinyltransferase [Simkaniaceae bacterium]MCF7853111.1 dihydrolipoyllysine-residue succinyltransferase [Simkaniaceae bacterium]
MSEEIKVPEFGESITEAVVVQLIKKSGDYVEKGEDLIELETDKVNSVISSPASGVVSLTVDLEARVSVGQTIGSIDTSAQKTASLPPEEPPKQAEPEKIAPPPEQPARSEAPSAPSARSTPDQFLSSLTKSPIPERGPDHPVAPSGRRKKMSSLRKTIASHLVRVKNETAMLTTFNEIDMSEVMRIRTHEKDDFLEKHGVKLGFMSFFIKACVHALKAFPDVGAAIDGDDIVYPEHLGIGVAVSTERGLMVPVIKHCEELSFSDIEKALQVYAGKAREGKIPLDALKGGCFTITNGGVFGSLVSTPIINAGQSAILGMHAIQKRAVVVDDQIVIRPMMYLALSYDHRIIDGKEAIGFLVHIKENLEEPSRLLLDF